MPDIAFAGQESGGMGGLRGARATPSFGLFSGRIRNDVRTAADQGKFFLWTHIGKNLVLCVSMTADFMAGRSKGPNSLGKALYGLSGDNKRAFNFHLLKDLKDSPYSRFAAVTRPGFTLKVWCAWLHRRRHDHGGKNRDMAICPGFLNHGDHHHQLDAFGPGFDNLFSHDCLDRFVCKRQMPR